MQQLFKYPKVMY